MVHINTIYIYLEKTFATIQKFTKIEFMVKFIARFGSWQIPNINFSDGQYKLGNKFYKRYLYKLWHHGHIYYLYKAGSLFKFAGANYRFTNDEANCRIASDTRREPVELDIS